MKHRRIEITTETYEVLVISRRGNLRRIWCASCDRHISALSLNDAVRSGLCAETIRQLAESGQLHLLETEQGASFICLNSLIQR